MPGRHHHDEEREPIRSDEGRGEAFDAVMRRRLSRRGFLRGGAATAGLVAFAGAPAARAAAQEKAASADAPLGVNSLPASTEDRIDLAAGHVHDVLLRWGDPVLPGAPDFDPLAQSPEAQAAQFGYNCDYIGYLPIDGSPDRGLLVVNHEYVNSELMFPGYDASAPTAAQVGIEKAAHGLSVVEVRRGEDGRWAPVPGSDLNRRITADTPMEITGPAAASDALRTNADPDGRRVLGTLNNCAGGKTPWGTVLTAEENIHQYFANLSAMAEDDPMRAVHERYGVGDESSWGWERYDGRFDLAGEPNEPNRFGWVVELDPYNPASTPRKRTALGRFRHEGATTTVAPDGRVVVYSGDDAYFEYVYKFVSRDAWNPDVPAPEQDVLDDGTLYVARFQDDGRGEWVPLVHGQGPLTAQNGFHSQADVLVNTRGAADLLGATKMDRPEDIQANPVTKRVYVALTKNPQRGAEGQPPPDAANPRADNTNGHVLELREAGDDHGATRFDWEVFLLCGDPEDESTYFAGYPKEGVSEIAAPDNVTFDGLGNLWIATDGQPSALEIHDSLYAVPTEGEERGRLRRFLSTVAGAEVCGPEFSNDDRTLFVAVQHPGDGGTFEAPASRWPDGLDGMPPRPSVLAIRNEAGGRVGGGGSAALPEALPATGAPAAGLPAAAAGLGLAAAGLGALLRRKGAVAEAEARDEGDARHPDGAASTDTNTDASTGVE